MDHKPRIFVVLALTFTLLALATRIAQPGTLNTPDVASAGAKTNIDAQAEAAADFARANEKATAHSTALAQSVMLAWQNEDELVARAQTAVTNNIATQTQAARKPTNTPTIRQMLKDHIVFYLIEPEKGRQDACGDIKLVPIISKRMRSDDKVKDVQIALQMLFSVKRKIYVQWYNALWDTDLRIDTYQYTAQKDYMTINFAGYLPAGQLSNCDKHGIREQIWTTFFHYGIKEKTFTINNTFLIDELSRKTK
jgi:hypothetical protein